MASHFQCGDSVENHSIWPLTTTRPNIHPYPYSHPTRLSPSHVTDSPSIVKALIDGIESFDHEHSESHECQTRESKSRGQFHEPMVNRPKSLFNQTHTLIPVEVLDKLSKVVRMLGADIAVNDVE